LKAFSGEVTVKTNARNQSRDMSPDEMANFEENVIQGEDPGDLDDGVTGPTVEHGDRLTKSGRVTLEDVEDAIKKSDTDVRPKVTK
jgi:hypothetical protein